jgi:tRNA(Leu) C34 or U34 (ribose-2'-O)-methylase TrmL
MSPEMATEKGKKLRATQSFPLLHQRRSCPQSLELLPMTHQNRSRNLAYSAAIAWM